jgi:hypothetical protein
MPSTRSAGGPRPTRPPKRRSTRCSAPGPGCRTKPPARGANRSWRTRGRTGADSPAISCRPPMSKQARLSPLLPVPGPPRADGSRSAVRVKPHPARTRDRASTKVHVGSPADLPRTRSLWMVRSRLGSYPTFAPLVTQDTFVREGSTGTQVGRSPPLKPCGLVSNHFFHFFHVSHFSHVSRHLRSLAPAFLVLHDLQHLQHLQHFPLFGKVIAAQPRKTALSHLARGRSAHSPLSGQTGLFCIRSIGSFSPLRGCRLVRG